MKSNRFFLLLIIIAILFSCRKEIDIKAIYEESIDEAIKGNYINSLLILQRINISQRDYWYYLYYGFYTSKLPGRNFDKVLEYYQKAFELKPESQEYNIIYLLGSTYYELQDYKNAIKYLEKAAKMYDEVQIFNPLGYPFAELSASYYNIGDYDKSLIAVDKNLEMDSSHAWSYMQKGLILSHVNKDIISLRKYYDEAMLLSNNNYLFAIDYTKRLLEMEKDKRAYDESIKWIEKGENNGWAYANLGYFELLNGEWDAAYTSLDEAFQKYGHKPGHDQLIALYRSFYLFYTGDFAQAYLLYLYYKYQTYKFSSPKLKYPEDYIDELENNILFQRLFKKHGNPYE